MSTEETGIKNCGKDFISDSLTEGAEGTSILTSSSDFQQGRRENFCVKFRREYVWDAINHYMRCNRGSVKEGEFSTFGGTEKGSKLKSTLGIFETQISVIEALHKYFIEDKQRHITVLTEMTPPSAFDDRIQKTNIDAYIQTECSKPHDDEHYCLVRKLLEVWELWDEYFQEQDDNGIHICFIAKEALARKSSELRYLGDSIETIQSLFWRRISREDFLNREQAIRTIQRHMRSNNIRTSIEHMFFKPKNMVHIGGAILDLSMEEAMAGRNINKLDLKEDIPQWRTISTQMPRLTAHAGVAVSGNKVFISGGRNSSGSYLFNWETKTIVYNTAFLLTLHDERLSPLLPMGDSRSHHGFVTFKGSFWAIGGSNGIVSLDTVESYDPTKQGWFKRPSLQQDRSGSAVTVHNNQIWVIGGRNTNGDILSSVEIYDPKDQMWRYSCNLPKPLLLSAAVSNLGQLFVIGGLTGTKDNPIAEAAIYRWDNIVRQWKFWNNMKEPRLNHSATRYGQYISICGGHGLVKGVPTHVSGAISFCVTSGDQEFYTPTLGTQRIGVGITMAGDSTLIDDIIQKTFMYQAKRGAPKDCLSCMSSYSVQRQSLAYQQSVQKTHIKNITSEISFATGISRLIMK